MMKDLDMVFSIEIYSVLKYNVVKRDCVTSVVHTRLKSPTTRLIREQQERNEYAEDEFYDDHVLLAERKTELPSTIQVPPEVTAAEINEFRKCCHDMIKSDSLRMKMIMHVGYLHAMEMLRNLKQCDDCEAVISEDTRCGVCTLAAKRPKRRKLC